MNIPKLFLAFVWLASVPLVHGASADDLQTLELTVDGVARTALVHAPPGKAGAGAPVVFVFHGHGGNSRKATEVFGVNRLWPEAISVYPQGLDTPGRTDPDGGRSGWQKAPGDQGDRDLRFFDALLARVSKNHAVDPKRVYVTGHSNGAGFTYLLWLERSKVIAAVAPSSGGAAGSAAQLPPKPAMILAGRNDLLVQLDRQERIMEWVRRNNGCDQKGQRWQGVGTLYPSKGGTPLVTFVHEGGHQPDPATPSLVVKFFQEQAATAAAR